MARHQQESKDASETSRVQWTAPQHLLAVARYASAQSVACLALSRTVNNVSSQKHTCVGHAKRVQETCKPIACG